MNFVFRSAVGLVFHVVFVTLRFQWKIQSYTDQLFCREVISRLQVDVGSRGLRPHGGLSPPSPLLHWQPLLI